MARLIDRHAQKIVGVPSCYDRVVIRGTLPSVWHVKAMATTLDARGIRLFDYAKSSPSRCEMRFVHTPSKWLPRKASRLEYIKKPTTYRKEDRIRQILSSEAPSGTGLFGDGALLGPRSARQERAQEVDRLQGAAHCMLGFLEVLEEDMGTN